MKRKMKSDDHQKDQEFLERSKARYLNNILTSDLSEAKKKNLSEQIKTTSDPVKTLIKEHDLSVDEFMQVSIGKKAYEKLKPRKQE